LNLVYKGIRYHTRDTIAGDIAGNCGCFHPKNVDFFLKKKPSAGG
jgi:hypothetical protein